MAACPPRPYAWWYLGRDSQQLGPFYNDVAWVRAQSMTLHSHRSLLRVAAMHRFDKSPSLDSAMHSWSRGAIVAISRDVVFRWRPGGAETRKRAPSTSLPQSKLPFH